MFSRISGLTWSHPWRVLVATALLAVVAVAFGHGVEDHPKAAGFTDPDSESERAGALLTTHLGHSAQPAIVVLVRDPDGGPLGIEDADVRAEVSRLADRLASSDYVGQVTNPLADTPAAGSLIAADHASLVLTAQLTTSDVEDKGGLADESVRGNVSSDLLDVGFGGFAPSFNEVNDQTRRDLTNAELIAFPVLAILLLIVFRGLVAAALPLVIGGLSIVGTLLALRVMASLVDTSLFALNIATALSLGLAVDYALLLVSRFREEVALHGYTETAHQRTIATAGRTALFSGLTVAGAMAALIVMPQRFLYSVGAAGAIVGVLSALTALLVAPSLLRVLGPRIESLPIIRRRAPMADSGRWMRLARLVMARPLLVAVLTSAGLLALAAPLVGTTLTGPSAQAVPPGQQSYAVNAYLQGHYGREVSEGISLTVSGPVSDASLADLQSRVGHVPDVSYTAPFSRADDTVAYATAALTVPALSAPGQDALRAIRALSDPAGGELLVAGNTASFIDEKQSLLHNAPTAVVLIVGFTTLLLFMLTGSVLLPLKTLVMNGLTLAASLGILVMVFERRFLVGLLDYPGPYAVEVTSLVFLFAVAFALATDYAVLVLARIKELRDGGMTNEDAVAHGIARTGRIISAAALMISSVFLAFAVSPVFFMKQIAVGMALGVIIDATVVRGMLVPSLMKLLGSANWWAPGPLRRLHDRFGIRES